MHEHKDCKHELKYCKVCDVAYCVKCQREWYQRQYNWTWTSPTISYPPIVTYGEGTGTPLPENPVTICGHHNHD